MAKNNDYKPGNPEYDFWNDKNLYPSLRNEGDMGWYSDDDGSNSSNSPAKTSNLEDTKVSGGTVFAVVFGWLGLLAPFALFCSWEDGIVQGIFWGGLAVIVLTFIAWMCNSLK